MKSVYFPRLDSAWIRRLIEADAVAPKPIGEEVEIEASLPSGLHRAYQLAPQVVTPSSAPKRGLRKRFKGWLQEKERRRISRFLEPQRQFNDAIVSTLNAYIRTTERRLLSIEATQKRLANELDLLKERAFSESANF